MRLTIEAVEKVESNTDCKNRLAVELKCHFKTIERRLAANKNNGTLTMNASVRIISKETGLSKDQILTNE